MHKKSKYGYIEFIDKRKLKHDGWDDEIEPEIRKPTPLEREEIILNYVRVNSGKSVKVSFFAEQLAVSERTIQTALKSRKQRLDQTNPSSARQKKTSRIYPDLYGKTENPVPDRSHIEKAL